MAFNGFGSGMGGHNSAYRRAGYGGFGYGMFPDPYEDVLDSVIEDLEDDIFGAFMGAPMGRTPGRGRFFRGFEADDPFSDRFFGYASHNRGSGFERDRFRDPYRDMPRRESRRDRATDRDREPRRDRATGRDRAHRGFDFEDDFARMGLGGDRERRRAPPQHDREERQEEGPRVWEQDENGEWVPLEDDNAGGRHGRAEGQARGDRRNSNDRPRYAENQRERPQRDGHSYSRFTPYYGPDGYGYDFEYYYEDPGNRGYRDDSRRHSHRREEHGRRHRRRESPRRSRRHERY